MEESNTSAHNAVVLEGMKKDIEYIKKTMEEIKNSVKDGAIAYASKERVGNLEEKVNDLLSTINKLFVGVIIGIIVAFVATMLALFFR